MVQDRENKNQKAVIVNSIEDLELFASSFLGELSQTVSTNTTNAKVFGLCGDLGAGKTTFSKCIAKGLGIQETVTSPTFGIQKQYKITNPKFIDLFTEFVHIDAYRIEDIKETEPLRFVELFQKPNILIFIEWPEKISEILPKDTIVLSFESIDENARKISY